MDTPRPVHSDRTKTEEGLNRSKKVRVIAKIRGFADLEAESANWVCVNKPKGDESDSVIVSFGDKSSSRQESYKLDYCYEQNEGNSKIFSREVKPLISGVFDGFNATIIAYGAKGSGKTYVVQGSEKEPGLAALAMAEILSLCEETGKSITISIYEIFQDHVYDLLDPKRPEVHVLENGQGKIQLKGLSEVPVNSISEFQKLYISGHNSVKPVQKITMELPRRSHKGLVVNVTSESDALSVGKMNFVDLTGYEDTRRKSSEKVNLVESIKINKSIYALNNVVYAMNANESYVPYRESKLTRMLQDSLGAKSRILLVTCLNQSFCQDSMYMVSLASRSCQGINQIVSDTAKKTKSSARPTLLSSRKSQLPGSVSTIKKQIGSQMLSSTKKANGVASVMKGRKLFDETSYSTKSKQMAEKMSSSSDIAPTIRSFVQEQESSIPDVTVDKDSTSTVEKDGSPVTTINPQETAISDKDCFLYTEDKQGEVTPSINNGLKMKSIDEESQNIGKENNHSLINKDESPLISERLQEISNNLKQLISSTPLRIEMRPKNDTLSNIHAWADIVEPKTPDQSMVVYDKLEVANVKSPWETFNMRSSGMKNSLVQEYLRLLNTGSKDDLKRLKGIGEKRATYILELREESSEPFKNLDDLKDIGLSAKQIKGMMKKEAGDLFN